MNTIIQKATKVVTKKVFVKKEKGIYDKKSLSKEKKKRKKTAATVNSNPLTLYNFS